MQLLELNMPMVVALNMMDEMSGNGGTVLINELEAHLGVPVVPISAAKGEGIDELVSHVLHVAYYQEKPQFLQHFDNQALDRCINAIEHLIEDHAKKARIPLSIHITTRLVHDCVFGITPVARNERVHGVCFDEVCLSCKDDK